MEAGQPDEHAHRAAILSEWSANTSYSERLDVLHRDFEKEEACVEATSQLGSLLNDLPGRFDRLVEVGSGDGRYLDYLQRRGLPLTMLGSDIESPRLARARREFPALIFEAGDIIAVQKRHARPGTVFLAIDVLGNIVPSDLNAFLERLALQSCALVFCAGGLSIDSTDEFQARPGLGYNHNFRLVISRHKLRFLRYLVRYAPNIERRATLTATVLAD